MSADKRDSVDLDELHVWLEDKLRQEGREDLANVLKGCRVPMKIECLCCGEQKVVSKGCKKRWCPVCGPKVTAARYERVAPIAARMKWPLAVMLSKENPKDIEGCVADLAAAFRRFRRLKFWRNTVRGGFVGYEMTHNGNGVHVHLHCLVDCRWLAIATPEPTRRHTHAEKERLMKMAQAELAAAWAACLGQSTAIVWARRADKRALAESIKYPFKPADFKKLKCRVSDIIDEIDAGRRVASFGVCHAANKEFLGRDPLLYYEKLCGGCLTDRSQIPADVIAAWFHGREPTRKQAALYDSRRPKINDEARVREALRHARENPTPISRALAKRGIIVPLAVIPAHLHEAHNNPAPTKKPRKA